MNVSSHIGNIASLSSFKWYCTHIWLAIQNLTYDLDPNAREALPSSFCASKFINRVLFFLILSIVIWGVSDGTEES